MSIWDAADRTSSWIVYTAGTTSAADWALVQVYSASRVESSLILPGIISTHILTPVCSVGEGIAGAEVERGSGLWAKLFLQTWHCREFSMLAAGLYPVDGF